MNRRERPRQVDRPEPGQESVWDYPRPPRVEDSPRRIRVLLGDVVIADTYRSKRVLETSLAPSYYLPPEDVAQELLRPSSRSTLCEWKGWASYYDVLHGDRKLARAAWAYLDPTPPYRELRGYVSFYPHELACFVDDERARPQEGGFYGGWITSEIVGPIKGAPRTEDW